MAHFRLIYVEAGRPTFPHGRLPTQLCPAHNNWPPSLQNCNAVPLTKFAGKNNLGISPFALVYPVLVTL